MSTPSPAPRVGDEAPLFTLPDQHGQEIALADLRGTNVVMVFYPFAFSGICTGELREVRDGLEDFQTDDIQVLTISCDSMYTHRVWADAEGHFFPLLSDFWPHGAVSRAYGVFNEAQGAPRRGTFLIDRQGRIFWSTIVEPGVRRDFSLYRAALADLRARDAKE